MFQQINEDRTLSPVLSFSRKIFDKAVLSCMQCASCTMHRKKTDVYHDGFDGLEAISSVNCNISSALVLSVTINTKHQPGPPGRMNPHKSKRISGP